MTSRTVTAGREYVTCPCGDFRELVNGDAQRDEDEATWAARHRHEGTNEKGKAKR